MSKQRILLKLSGESLAGSSGNGISYEACASIAQRIVEVHRLGHEVAIVIGGGNIFRGRLAGQLAFERVEADKTGMVATCVNGLILAQMLRTLGAPSHVYGSMGIETVIDRYHSESAKKRLQSGEIVVLVGGTGNPFFTTDTAAALRACELEADTLLKATKVDGVYSDDPEKNSSATRYETLTYDECLQKNLEIMDQTAFALCKTNSIPIQVFNLFEEGSIKKALTESKGSTLITGGTCQ